MKFIWNDAKDTLINLSHIDSIRFDNLNGGTRFRVLAYTPNGLCYTLYRGDEESCREFMEQFAEEEHGNG